MPRRRSPHALDQCAIGILRTWRLCPCGDPEETCERTPQEHAAIKWQKDREGWTAQVKACLADHKWVDPAPFRVPRS